MLDRYFTLEDPTRLEPARAGAVRGDGAGRRACGCAATSTGSTSRPAGEVRIVDYKTGTAPREEYEARALFQMKFYALVLWRLRGVGAALLQLIYLGQRRDRARTTRTRPTCCADRAQGPGAVAARSSGPRETGDWRPRPSRLCDWCAHQALCPAFGGTPPPMPVRGASGASGATVPLRRSR